MTDGSVVLAVVRLVFSLLLVLGLLVVIARVAGRRYPMGRRPGQVAVRVDVLARRPLGRGSSLQVVQVGEQVLVLGVTDSTVGVLVSLDPEELIELPALEPVPGMTPLSRLFARPAADPSTTVAARVHAALGLPAPQGRHRD